MAPIFGDTAAVLIVDDDEQLAGITARLLEREGYHCTRASSPDDALSQLAKATFALALVDVMMPGGSGLELAARMLDHHHDLAVVMVTGLDDPAIAELALESGAYGYLAKPFRRNELLITVSNAGRRRCLEIQQRSYNARLLQHVDDQASSAVSDGRYKALLDAAPDAIVAVEANGRIVLVNAQAIELLGYSREELLGQPVELLVPDAARPIHPARRRGYISDPRTRPMGAGMDLAARRKDGSEFPAEISLSTIETEDGVLVAAAIRDATMRRTVESKFRGLLEAAPDAIVGALQDGRIAHVNAQAERLFGYSREEMLGQPVEMLIPDHAHKAHPGHRDAYFADPKPRPMGAGMQLAGRRKDGSEFPAEISLSALQTEDGVLVSAAVRDVTERIEAQAEREQLRAQAERERLEGQLHQSQRLESLGQLAGGVAHDFNNLLAVILNYAAFIGEQVGEAADEPGGERWAQLRGDVSEVQRAAERAAQLTHQLLAFGRREIVRPEVLNLNTVVTSVEQLLRRSIGEHVELLADLSADASSIVADPGQIEQVLLNLAVNARDAMPDGGTLTIETGDVIADDDYISGRPGLERGRYVRLRVSDTGTGMDKEVIARAFEPFYTTKPKGEGSGLGLATVYGIITQAGGYAQVYSELGIGTTFTALFPVTDDGVAAPVEAKATVPHRRGGETVLVVEDEDAMREVARRILVRNGYTVLVAGGGDEAIAIAAQHPEPIDVLLTDVIMPRTLGKEVAEQVRELRPDVRVLYMSGYAQPVLTSRGTLSDGVILVEKPFNEAVLLAKINEALER